MLFVCIISMMFVLRFCNFHFNSCSISLLIDSKSVYSNRRKTVHFFCWFQQCCGPQKLCKTEEKMYEASGPSASSVKWKDAADKNPCFWGRKQFSQFNLGLDLFYIFAWSWSTESQRYYRNQFRFISNFSIVVLEDFISTTCFIGQMKGCCRQESVLLGPKTVFSI